MFQVYSHHDSSKTWSVILPFLMWIFWQEGNNRNFSWVELNWNSIESYAFEDMI